MNSTLPQGPTDATGWAGYFDEYAPTYAATAFEGAGLATISNRDLRAVHESLAGMSLHDGAPGRILDAGAGTGRITGSLLANGWDVVALDASHEMLNRLRETHPDVETVEAALGTRLPFADETFDAVVAMRVLKYVDDLRYALQELARVVRPGGRVVVEFANRRSLARFGYGSAPIHLVTIGDIDRDLEAANLEVRAHIAGPRVPQPVWQRARTERAAQLATVSDRACALILGGRRSRLGARNVIVSATRR